MKRRELLLSSIIGSALLMINKSAVAIELIASTATTKPTAPDTIPSGWIDPISKKKIIRLSQIDDSKSLYFHDNAFTHDSRYMVMNTPKGIGLYDFETHRHSLLVTGRYEAIMVSYTKPICYARKYTGEFKDKDKDKDKDNANFFDNVEYYAIEIPSGNAKFIGIFPQGFITSVNADDTLMAGTYATRFVELQPGPKMANTDGGYNAKGVDGKPLGFAEAKELRMAERLAKNIPMEIFTIDIATGKRKVVTRSNDWLNHVQFSPADPHKIMYCHEGPWHMVDRVWIIDTNGKNKQKIHQRTIDMEITGHEFFSFDGKTIYYDLQTPRGEVFWLATYNLETKKRRWYHLQRNAWSVHYQISRDGKLLAGDGGDQEMVARAADGKYLYLFEPEVIEDFAVSAPDAKQLIQPGKLNNIKLVDMHQHDYRVEPNLQFSPDGKYLVFRSNMHGPIHAYAVEL